MTLKVVPPASEGVRPPFPWLYLVFSSACVFMWAREGAEHGQCRAQHNQTVAQLRVCQAEWTEEAQKYDTCMGFENMDDALLDECQLQLKECCDGQ